MTGKVQQKSGAVEVSTGGSLIADAKLKQLYAAMVHCRLLTEYARKQRRAAGRYEASLGQEALTTGWVIDLQKGDTIAPAPRDGIASLVRGVPLSEIVAQLYAREVSSEAAHNIIPPSEPSTQFRAVTAVALAQKRKKKSNVVVAFAGADTSALACWHEALKLAVKRQLPIIFVVENNPWTATGKARSSTPQDGESLLQAARSYGLPAITVDGNDVVAVYRVACESLERVRHGDGPVLVEGKTYRASGQRRVRSERDPLIHMERYLAAKKLFSAGWKTQVADDFSRSLAATIKMVREKQ